MRCCDNERKNAAVLLTSGGNEMRCPKKEITAVRYWDEMNSAASDQYRGKKTNDGNH